MKKELIRLFIGNKDRFRNWIDSQFKKAVLRKQFKYRISNNKQSYLTEVHISLFTSYGDGVHIAIDNLVMFIFKNLN